MDQSCLYGEDFLSWQAGGRVNLGVYKNLGISFFWGRYIQEKSILRSTLRPPNYENPLAVLLAHVEQKGLPYASNRFGAGGTQVRHIFGRRKISTPSTIEQYVLRT